ncbi:ubiquitin carboxyl-terminal hydrolase 16-like isoform X1 [Mizuhopecten yessoensis]|uniref:ubiquitin carboxyl-terminal hydrolase 16-like isoform X1 n=1 Tax=Mizuhopecten yessoensis TaxID=6573 RepID=UPI000B45CCBC|nr:ubiquitin carboxyl-terminal hydrolase 16-like isoform X1 [Mizuhopecten yessoensis]
MAVTFTIIFEFAIVCYGCILCGGFPLGHVASPDMPSEFTSTGVHVNITDLQIPLTYCAQQYPDNTSPASFDVHHQAHEQGISPQNNWIILGIVFGVYILILIFLACLRKCLLQSSHKRQAKRVWINVFRIIRTIWRLIWDFLRKFCCCMSPEQRQVSGIPNIGNTCYMNAVLQVLCWTPNFKEQLRKATEVIDLPNPQGLDKDSATDERSVTSPRIDKSLLKLVDSVRAGKTVRKSLPNAILDDVRQLNDRIEGHNQQDSYELFNTIIAGLEDLIEERCNCDNQTEQLMNKSPVSRLFSGAFFTAFTYESCNHIETKFQRFTSIPVQIIPKTNLLSNNSSVKESSVPSNSQEAEKGDTDRQYQDNHSDAYNNCSDTEYTSLSDHRSASKHATDLLHHQYVRCLRTLENNSWGHTDLGMD